ncbi:MAG TPA: type II toxin-antitoxin system HicB family antitoxin, partial [Pyrinomonadaceae bacterium]|nr:type II toxin-antitoxin system HicB family antitoxin [Pyrinomonadaceae bacterium]
MRESAHYPLIIYPAEEGGYVAEIPALKGCLAQGETLTECLQELQKSRSFGLRAQNVITEKYQAL